MHRHDKRRMDSRLIIFFVILLFAVIVSGTPKVASVKHTFEALSKNRITTPVSVISISSALPVVEASANATLPRSKAKRQWRPSIASPPPRSRTYPVTRQEAFEEPQPCPTYDPSIDNEKLQDISYKWYQLHLMKTEYVAIGEGHHMSTRTFGGSIPGCTLSVTPGDTLAVELYNDLSGVGGVPFDENTPGVLMGNDETNLHLHGLHIDGDWPSDSIYQVVYPGKDRPFVAKITESHLPGTHWVHPHRHGSTTLQVLGGAAAAVIVEPRAGEGINAAVDAADEKILVFMPVYGKRCKQDKEPGDEDGNGGIDLRNCAVSDFAETWQELKATYKDDTLDISRPGNFALLNGKVMPEMNLRTGSWTRFRMINTAYYEFGFDFKILRDGDESVGHDVSSGKADEVAPCELRLLSKDGIFVRHKGKRLCDERTGRNYLRKITSAPIHPGGRADVMVCCRNAGRYNIQAYSDFRPKRKFTLSDSNPYAGTIVVDGDDAGCGSLGEIPEHLLENQHYLQDTFCHPELDQTDAPCSCATTLNVPGGNFTVNDRTFEPNIATHMSVQGVTQQRLLNSNGHPYHQHVIPFQINTIESPAPQEIPIDASEDTPLPYTITGDWHDVWEGIGKIRFNPVLYSGKMVMHCHRLPHEDKGMMGTEYIQPPGSTCKCDRDLIEMEKHDPTARHIPDKDSDPYLVYKVLAVILSSGSVGAIAVLIFLVSTSDDSDLDNWFTRAARKIRAWFRDHMPRPRSRVSDETEGLVTAQGG